MKQGERVAAVEILRADSEQKISGTATGELLESGWTDSTPYVLPTAERQQIWLAAATYKKVFYFTYFAFYRYVCYNAFIEKNRVALELVHLKFI